MPPGQRGGAENSGVPDDSGTPDTPEPAGHERFMPGYREPEAAPSPDTSEPEIDKAPAGHPAPSKVEERKPSPRDLAEEGFKRMIELASDDRNDDGLPGPPESEKGSPLDRISNFLSWVFVPLLTPVYGMLFILTLSVLAVTAQPAQKWVATLVIAGINVAVPAVVFFVLKILGVVSDIGLNRRRERTLPYMVVFLCYLASAKFLTAIAAPLWVSLFYAGGALAALVNFIVNFKWKISAHAAGMGGVVALLVYIAHQVPDMRTVAWLCAWLVFTGLLCAARVWLRRHTVAQVIAGMANGSICVWGFVFLLS